MEVSADLPDERRAKAEAAAAAGISLEVLVVQAIREPLRTHGVDGGGSSAGTDQP